jgi:uncharacterized membrane protein YhiD involved in acid resistance
MDILTNFFVDAPQLGPLDTLINIVLAGIMAYIVRIVYINYGTALSNRRHFGNSFILITICTALVIALIQSSIALSLGLVGALSIIRFRTAIKEPQELSYIFLCVAIGLGFGANERLITLAAGFLILAIIVLTANLKKKKTDESYNMTISTKKAQLDDIVKIISEFSQRSDLRRFDDNAGGLSVIMFTEFKKYEALKNCTDALKNLDQEIEINFISCRTLG